MPKLNKKQIARYITFICLSFVAPITSVVTRIIGHTTLVFSINGLVQTTVYVGLTLAWTVSVHKRVVQANVRRLLEYTGIVFSLWFLFRATKYYVTPLFGNDPTVNRYLWYSYYIAMLFVPAMIFLVANYMGKPESYTPPKKLNLILFSVSALLLCLVFTNDLHKFVFRFPDNATVFTDEAYSYGFGYALISIWMGICAFAAVVLMIKKCRIPNTKRIIWLPFSPLIFDALFCIAYGFDLFPKPFNDLVAMHSFVVMATYEMAILTGLIRSNTRYVELFKASELATIITDNELSTAFLSDSAVEIDTSLLRRAEKNSSVINDGMRISAYRITDGYAFWQEDISELIAVTEDLQDVKTDLEEQYLVSQEKYATSHKRQILVEKNRLYNIMQSETQEKVNMLSSLIDRLERTKAEAETRLLTVEIAVLCTYLKRRNNLLFIQEDSSIINGVELTYCIRESLNNFKLCGATVQLKSELSENISFENITKLYDAFESAVETALHKTDELYVALNQTGNTVYLRMSFVCSSDLSALADIGFIVDDEGENEWCLEYSVKVNGVEAE